MRTVLVVDDNWDQRSILATALRARGWAVETAVGARTALAAAAELVPQHVVTELILPDARGFDCVRHLRVLLGPSAVLIALTRMPEQLHRPARAAGFDDVMTKPVDYEVLHRLLLRSRPLRRTA